MRNASKGKAITEPEENGFDFQIEDFEIQTEDENQALLGRGSFATVYLARCKKDGRLYALKVVK